ncbi:DEAD/DEAH box helicase [Thermosediminibacter litoriperuensis]|uniref:SNF2 family DNA or RNA helicase n=1 Tax=Thermosediminibacter litoriperuensis TaxID=291989 RepID=A0A5S5AZ80_9FIRM|nr:DEAD/DEAH box helicase [Thermosediminibacter litoriperuensis]TYP58585.1 SNF2 family DNA or RNA helicase [Thermosediminibacter litoriperuensis]
MVKTGELDRLLERTPPEIVKRGIEYYKAGAVESVSAFRDLLYAVVRGHQDYDVFLHLRGNILEDYSCTCPAFMKYEGVCKHIIAVLCHILKSGMEPKNNFPVRKRDIEVEVIGELLSRANEKKQAVKVEYRFEFFPYGVYEFISRMHMRIGTERMYILKDVKEFIEKIERGQPVEFGKFFKFHPLMHEFSDEDRKVFSVIKEIYEIERSLRWHGSSKMLLNERYVNLNITYLKKIARALGNKMVRMTAPYVGIVSFEPDGSPFSVAAVKCEEGIAVRARGDMGTLLDGEHRVILKDSKIYILDADDPAYPLIKGLFLRRDEGLKFTGENQRKLISVLPRLEKSKYVELSEDLKDAIEKRPLKLRVRIDGFKKGIAADVKFVYGEREIDPFGDAGDEGFIVRDYEREGYTLKLLEDSGFSREKGRLVLLDDDNLYTFIKDVVPRLAEMGDVLYSSEVKHLFSTKAPKIKSYVRSLSGNLLEIKMDFEGIDGRTAEEILRSIKEKKKYFRLKNGSFLSLEDEQVKNLANLLEDVPKDDIKQNAVSLSKYRLMGFMGKIRGKALPPFDHMAEFEKVIDEIVNSKNQKIAPPASLAGVLREYQVTGFKWLKVLADNGLGGVLADDMGLGKTLQTIAFLLSVKESGVKPRTSLVVAPSTLIYNWENEIARFAPQLKTMVVSGPAAERRKMIEILDEYDVVVTSYPLLRNDVDFYAKHYFYCVVLDEAQHIKNFDSLNAKSVKKISSRARFALTGTPMENSPAELWSIFDFIMPGYLYSYKKFNEVYQKPVLNGDEGALKELKKLISPFILRRTKKDVLRELPEKIETTLKVDMTPQQKKLYLSYLMKIKGEIEERIEREGFEKNRMHIFSGLLRLRQICCHPGLFIENYRGSSGKMELLEELLQELMDGGHRILIFSQFTSMLSLIRKSLEKMNIRYAYLDGSTGVSERKRIVDDFNSGGGQVFLLSLKAGGVGLNLTSADTVIHFDPWWNPAVEEQAADRAYRMGQENNVQVFRLITRGTIEEKIDELQKKKKDLIGSIVSEGEVFINFLSKEEIMELFRMN